MSQDHPQVRPPATARLRLDPLRVSDADEMAVVLAAPELYAVIGGEPPDVATLRRRYAAQVAGPPDPRRQWLNWVLRSRDDHGAVGYVQATVERREDGLYAEVAWVVGLPWQGRGFASEAARALVEALDAAGVALVVAHVAPGHVASERVAAAAGLSPTDVVQDGEVRWERARPVAARP